MDAYVGAIWAFGFNFPPYGWALCNGALLQISQNEVLFSLIGTTYGGDGQTTFALPNLQGRVPIGTGQGPGLPNYTLAQAGGHEEITLTAANLATHTHAVLGISMPASSAVGETNDPNNNYFAGADGAIGNVYNSVSGSTMGASTPGNTGIAGSGLPLSILSPYQAINYSICLVGIYPTRN